jgi:hypothetical protein
MQERDDTIQDKEKRIYDLKKKNQELEKFKFVLGTFQSFVTLSQFTNLCTLLDYKIQELKKQVEPREQDIIKLSQQIHVRIKLPCCKCVNSSLF